MGQWSILSDLLDKVQSHSTVFGKVWMSVLFLFRIFILAAGIDKIWGDEQTNMSCNTQSVGCRNLCYNKSFPLSHTRLWVLQILTVSTPTLVYLGHVLLVIRKENKMRKCLQQKMDRYGVEKVPKYSDDSGKVKLKGVLLVSYTLQLVFKMLFEVLFIVGQYYIYGFITMPRKITCSDYPCREPEACFISRSTEKTIFIIFMLAMSVFSVVLHIMELFYLMFSKVKNRKRRSSGSVPQKVCPYTQTTSRSRETVTLC
uniref:Connexin 28.1 n=1 Tax=Iconisemion striatum TaxID=60296 RepID=A0A1A7YTK9_9TELE